MNIFGTKNITTSSYVNNDNVVLIRKNNSKEVTAYHDAVMWYNMMGDGILSGAYNELQASYSNGKVTIKSGLCLFGGRLIQITPNQQIEVDVSSFGNSSFYLKVMLNINEDDSLSDAGLYASLEASTQTGENVITDGPGIYYYDLYKFNPPNPTPELIAHKFTPGETKNALNISGASGTYFNGIPFDEVFYKNTENKITGVQYSKNAEVAVEAQGFVGGDINIVDENLHMPNRDADIVLAAYLVKNQNVILEVLDDPDVGTDSGLWKGPPIEENITKILTYTNYKLDRSIVMVYSRYLDESTGYMTNFEPVCGKANETTAIQGLEEHKSFFMHGGDIECFYSSKDKVFYMKNRSSLKITLNNLDILILFNGGK